MDKNLRLGDILINYDYITQDQLASALELQKKGAGKRVGEVLLEMGVLTEDELLIALSRRLNLEIIDFKSAKINLETVELLPKNISVKYNIVPIDMVDGQIVLVLNDPLDFYAIEDVKSFLDPPSIIVLAKKDDVRKIIDKSYSELDTRTAASTASGTISIVGNGNKDVDLAVDNSATPVVNLVNSILLKAYADGTSDIHIEPYEHYINVRFRIDGQLLQYMELEASLAMQIATRIKIISDLDIAERRIPQDGNFKIHISGSPVGVRVSTIPTIYGEKIVMRFLSHSVAVDNMETYGMNQRNYERIARILKNPHGIIYITGPTGSGKTTTLYGIIERMVQNPINVSTIEDPVERDLKGVVQVQVNPAAGLTFAAGLRSMLRQDPDVLLVGETRDTETAQIAVSAAITGHLVLSTLHTNDAINSIIRLGDMGIPNYLIGGAVAGLVAQRLVKKICPLCKEVYTPSEAEKSLFPNATQLARGKGCSSCNNSGYKGRIAVHEVLEMDNEIRRILASGEPVEKIYGYVRENDKMTFIADDVFSLVMQGITSVAEYEKQASGGH